jgi:hypothetical protein
MRLLLKQIFFETSFSKQSRRFRHYYRDKCWHYSALVELITKYSNPITGLERPWVFQEAKAPRFQDNQHMKVVGFVSPRHWPPLLISVTGWVNPRAIVLQEGLDQRKIPMTPSGIEPATCWVVDQYLNQLISLLHVLSIIFVRNVIVNITLTLC